VARTNLAYNQVTDRVTLHQGSIEVFISENPLGGSNAADSASHPAPSSTRIQFDLILANVLAGAIRELLQAGLSQLLGKEGVLIASGVRSNELGSVEAAMLATGLRLDQSVEKEGWCALAARRDQPVDLQSTQQAPPPNNSLV
jgi:ribosomal protein L11 methylase PrmA